MTLEDRMYDVLFSKSGKQCDFWDLANILYDDCMKTKQKSNGVRIANIRQVCNKSSRIGCYVNSFEGHTAYIK